MIESVRAYIKTIAEFMLFLIIIRMLATEKSRKYINFASGIILVLIAASPIMEIIGMPPETIMNNILNAAGIYSEYNEDFSLGETENALMPVFKANVEKSIQADIEGLGIVCLNVDCGVSDDFERTGGIESVTATIEGQSGGDEAENFIKRKYGVENVNIIYQ